ncbi:hypothetical protein FJ960_24495 [Mesorhizobium sp. B2-3-11]|uniref:GAP1-N1 domain-containing protein n=1 Tax=Mesorhizobium sp. B2-3-11 TaxID=2589953 RepID=UPI00112C9E01|nr:hypothetical protein [Mesorhizobium sp. B2-3-11]TPL97151.1 hypothetical protein FJ960_24495 [Mesorhizobium sp. B2-3-11]
MSAAAHDSIDQALFGYADGHRQIASSVRLPPRDLFLLSSASDLASGARLGEQDSYLSGLPLPESRRYAVFRTWAAPEMPRPGCVWSHVLLLGPKTSGSVPALSGVLQLFRRPVLNETSLYENPLDVPLARAVEPANVDLISEIIAGYYTAGRAILSPDSGEPDEIENAVLAVWSQQWPRLRSTFTFCTASLSDNRRTDQNDYSVQVAPRDEAPLETREKWVLTAAVDAALNQVTPLRRFLWRYGRDITASRRQYRMIVDLYVRFGNADVIPADTAFDVFRALPDPLEGAVLKRDILGLGPSSPRLVAAISAVDLLQILTSKALPETPTTAQVGARLGELSSREIGTVARYYAANKKELSPWKHEINRAIVALADKSSVTTEYPSDMLADVLLARKDLIDADSLALVANDVLPQLLEGKSSASHAHVVIREMLQRDLGDIEDLMISSRPALVFQFAVEAHCENRIHESWLDRLSRQGEEILRLNWLSLLRSTKEFASALSILRYPRNLAKSSAEIARLMSAMVDDAQGNERTTMQAALLRIAIDEETANSWDLISLVLPELRVVVVNAGLSRTAKSMLESDLPHFYSASYWDLNKRILLSLSKLSLVAPNNNILNRLALTPAEMEIVLRGEDRPKKSSLLKFWDWP